MSPRRDTEDFERIYAAYYEPLCRFAYSMVRSVDMAQEIVGDVFAALWEQYSRWHPPAGEGAYLYRAVRNRVANHRRDVHRRTIRDDGFAHEVRQNQEHASEELMLETVDLAARIWAEVDKLPERAREILVLHWQHQLPFPEIAHILEMSAVAVRVQHSRALERLRHALGDLFT